MSDEIWSDIIYDNKEFCTYSSVSEYASTKSFTVYGFSKTFGLAGLRIVRQEQRKMKKNMIKFRNCTGIECPLFQSFTQCEKGDVQICVSFIFTFSFASCFAFACGVMSGPDFKWEFRHTQSRKALFQMRIIP